MSQYESREPAVSGWAIGGITFAAALLLIIGVFEMISGISAIATNTIFVKTQDYVFNLDTTAWGWIHLILGVLLFLTGLGLMQRATWAGVVAIILAMLSAIANFFWIPYYPFWAIIEIALAIWVIWAITRPVAIRT
jgi:hypothetical protein